MELAALKPLRSRNFRLLFFSSVASTIGDWLDLIAILVLVSVVWQRGAFGLATVSVAAGLPLFAAPLVGVLVDRYRARTLMVGADLARAAVTAAVVFAPNLGVLAVLIALRSAAGVVFAPSAQSVVKRTVAADNLVQANASMQGVTQTLKMVGPALGGALLAVLAPRAVIGVNALSFLVSAVILSGLRVPAPASRAARSTYLADLGEGLRFVLRNGPLRLLVTALAGTVFLTFLYDSMLALVVPGLGLDRSYIGYLISAVGIGGVLGALVIAQWGSTVRPFMLMGAGQLAVGACVSLIGAAAMTTATAPGAVWLAIAALIGVAAAGVLVGFPTVVQIVTPAALLGRAWTAIGAVPTSLQVLAPTIGAALLTTFGIGQMFLVAGGGLVLLSFVTLVCQRFVWPVVSTSDAAPAVGARTAVPAVAAPAGEDRAD